MITLYPFQARGLDDGRAAYKRGARAVLFVGPTGMGKTTLAASAARGAIDRGRRVVAVAHRRELIVQMAQRFEAFGLEVGYLGRRPGALVQVTSVQTILARREMPDAHFVILDEAHHYVSDEWIAVPQKYLESNALVMGLTATPSRDDGKGLGRTEGGIFDELICVAQVRDLVALNGAEPDKGITPIDVWAPEGSVRRLALAPAEAYAEKAAGRSAVVFSPNVKSAEVFARQFVDAGIEALIVHGELDTTTRDRNLARFARGDVRVLCNVNVLTEGWDAPICDVCILARKVGSLSLLIQMIGRARRPYPGKQAALLLDLSGTLEAHRFHPDDELVYSLEGEGVRTRDGIAMCRVRLCRTCKLPLHDLIAEARAAGGELTHCPRCDLEISKIHVPTPEEVALARYDRDAARARAPADKRTKALTTLYAKGIREGHKRTRAEMVYRRMFKHHAPTEVRVPAWNDAMAMVAGERGDAWEPPQEGANGA